MPLMALVGSERPARSFSTTEAVAGRDSPKSSSLPIAMWTRALATSDRVAMVRAISPSIARRYLTFSPNSVRPKSWPSNSFQPGSALSAPLPANSSRSSSMRLAGTRMPRPPSSSSYGTFMDLRRVTICPIVSGSRSACSSR